jgi:hypothetical protein
MAIKEQSVYYQQIQAEQEAFRKRVAPGASTTPSFQAKRCAITGWGRCRNGRQG